MYNSVLFQESYTDLHTCLEAKWLSLGFEIRVKSFTELFLDNVWPEVRLVIVKRTCSCIAVRLFFVGLAENRIKNDNFSLSAQPCQYIWLLIVLSVLLNLHLGIIFKVVSFMMLSELKNDGLVHLALLTRIYDVHEIHTLEYQSIGALAEHFVHEESIIYEQAFDSLNYSCLVSIFFCKLYQLLNLIVLLFFVL